MYKHAALVADHWNGKLPLYVAIMVPLIAVHILAAVLLSLVTTKSVAGIFLVLLAFLSLLIWQIVGTFRATDQTIGATAGVMPVAAYGAIVLVVGSSLFQIADLVIPEWQGSQYQDPGQTALSVSGNGSAFLLEGEITLRVYSALEELISTWPDIKLIELNSKGGNIYAARGMARLVESAGLNSLASGQCFSACTLVFMAGANRMMQEDASLGFHGYRVGTYANLGNVILQDVQEEQEKDRVYLAHRGLSQAFIEKIYSIDHTALWQPTLDEMRRAGVFAD